MRSTEHDAWLPDGASRVLTIFSTLKPFHGLFAAIQRNAVRSWRRLDPNIEILLFDDAEGAAEIAAEVGARHLPHVRRNETGVPYINDMFRQACEQAKHDILCYVNGDMILTRDLLDALTRLPWCEFLGVGRRMDLAIDTPLSFEDGWEKALRAQTGAQGRLHGEYGIDYFLLPRSAIQKLQMPAFAVGRPAWDNWVIYRARALGIPVVDLTACVLAVHQDHDYSHHPKGRSGVHCGKEAAGGLRTAGGKDYLFSIGDATHLMTPEGLKPNRGISVRRRLRLFSVLHPWLGAPLRALRVLMGKRKSPAAG